MGLHVFSILERLSAKIGTSSTSWEQLKSDAIHWKTVCVWKFFSCHFGAVFFNPSHIPQGNGVQPFCEEWKGLQIWNVHSRVNSGERRLRPTRNYVQEIQDGKWVTEGATRGVLRVVWGYTLSSCQSKGINGPGSEGGEVPTHYCTHFTPWYLIP